MSIDDSDFKKVCAYINGEIETLPEDLLGRIELHSGKIGYPRQKGGQDWQFMGAPRKMSQMFFFRKEPSSESLQKLSDFRSGKIAALTLRLGRSEYCSIMCSGEHLWEECRPNNRRECSSILKSRCDRIRS